MKRIFILADDMTGAIDTAVKFVRAGLLTSVVLDEKELSDSIMRNDVTAYNMESRHIGPEKAYKKAFETAKTARLAGADIIFKKTDSAMRGNVGAEIKGAMDGTGSAIAHFAGAFPEKNRIVRNKTLYIDGLPAEKSPFAADPTDPIKTSRVDEIIKNTCPDSSGILIYDAENNADMKKICESLINGNASCIAGCAGLADAAAELMGKNATPHIRQAPDKDSRILVISGSVNSITQAQIRRAEEIGIYTHIIDYKRTAGNCIDGADGIERALKKEGIAVIATSYGRESSNITGKSDSKMIIDIICGYVKHLCGENAFDVIAVFGGDTLTGVLEALEIKNLTFMGEIESGTVVLKSHGMGIITKSGGFGDQNIILKIHEYVKGTPY